MKTLSKIALVCISVADFSAQAAVRDIRVVNVKPWDQGSTMGITTDKPTVKAGTITFEVGNDSKSLVHEMLVVKGISFDDSLPYDERTDRVGDAGTSVGNHRAPWFIDPVVAVEKTTWHIPCNQQS